MRDLGKKDCIIIGGGLTGYAAAVGMMTRGADIALFEDVNGAFQASRGNFGLVWAQSKGARSQDYASWTCRAVEQWPVFQDELMAATGINVHYRRGIGLHLCLSEQEFEKRSQLVRRISGYGLAGLNPKMIDRQSLDELLPGVGPDVLGASVCEIDGDCHSLFVYRALMTAFQMKGGVRIVAPPVKRIGVGDDGYYVVRTAGSQAKATKVLIAAGLGTNALAEPFGFTDLVYPQKGEILVTERAAPVLNRLVSSLRQTPEGTMLIGDSKEDTGYDDRSSRRGIVELARRAVRSLPVLAGVKVVRAWGALRVLTRDGDPIYDQSLTHPGIFVATTHSAVTLAPVHCSSLADWILGLGNSHEIPAFAAERPGRALC